MQDSQNFKSALFMMLSLSLFTCGDAIIKFLSDDLPIGQILFVRGILVCLLFSLLLTFKRQQILPKEAWNRWNLLRSVFEVAIAGCYLTGLVLLPLATAIILVFCGPIMLTILAATVLKEQVGWRRWSAVVIGFIGVLLVADLQRDSLNSWAVILPLTAAFITALRDIFVRNIPSVLSSSQIAFTTAWMVTLAGLSTLPFGWQALNSQQLWLLAIASLFIMGAYTTYIITTRMGELSFVAPFKYSSIPLAMLIGYLVWGDIPSGNSILGTAVIIASGMFILLRKRVKG
ncbi:MAG: DMT family transporter [Oceanospirillaceae bacterium]|nr:DMT family transporter [Oceanospirillaceae bacterium]